MVLDVFVPRVALDADSRVVVPQAYRRVERVGQDVARVWGEEGEGGWRVGFVDESLQTLACRCVPQPTAGRNIEIQVKEEGEADMRGVHVQSTSPSVMHSVSSTKCQSLVEENFGSSYDRQPHFLLPPEPEATHSNPSWPQLQRREPSRLKLMPETGSE